MQEKDEDVHASCDCSVWGKYEEKGGSYVVFTFQYGTTPLVWACRRGHKEIADMLLSENATVDNAGMVGNN